MNIDPLDDSILDDGRTPRPPRNNWKIVAFAIAAVIVGLLALYFNGGAQ